MIANQNLIIQFVQSIFPVFHSYRVPMISADISVNIIDMFIILFFSIGKETNIEISTSKIRNITATMKNLKENGIRDCIKGWNPHSNGELNSCVCFFLEDMNFEMSINTMEIINIK